MIKKNIGVLSRFIYHSRNMARYDDSSTPIKYGQALAGMGFTSLIIMHHPIDDKDFEWLLYALRQKLYPDSVVYIHLDGEVIKLDSTGCHGIDEYLQLLEKK